MSVMDDRKGKSVKCPCGYEWDYKGRLMWATCPNCQKKVRVKKGE